MKNWYFWREKLRVVFGSSWLIWSIISTKILFRGIYSDTLAGYLPYFDFLYFGKYNNYFGPVCIKHGNL